MPRNAMVPSRVVVDQRLHLLHLRILILLGVGAPVSMPLPKLYIGRKLDIEEPWLSISLRELQSWGYVAGDDLGYELRAASSIASAAPNGHMPEAR